MARPGRDFSMCPSIKWVSLFCLTQKNPSFAHAKSRPSVESVPCSNSEEENPFLWMIKNAGEKDCWGCGPVSCPRQGCLWGWGRLQELCLSEVSPSPRPMAPQHILSLAVFGALPRLTKVQETPLWVCVVYGFAFLFCCALIWLESNSDLVELSATPLFSNFHWHQETSFLSCCRWTEADAIMLRASEHPLLCVCVKSFSGT